MLKLARACLGLQDTAAAERHVATAMEIDRKTGSLSAAERQEVERLRAELRVQVE